MAITDKQRRERFADMTKTLVTSMLASPAASIVAAAVFFSVAT